MPDQKPHTVFGVVDRETAMRDVGIDFLNKMRSQEYPAPPFSQVTNIWPTEAETGRVVFEAIPSKQFYNPMGTVHGGWLSTLLDSAMGCAVHSMLKPGQAYTTVEMKVSFVRPVYEETKKLTCAATIVYFGGRIATSEGKIRDAEGNLVAHGTETCMILRA